MTTSGRPRPAAGPVALGRDLALAAALLLAASAAEAGSPLQADVARPDSTAGALSVETLPPGLWIRVDDVDVGRSPVGPLWIAPKTVRVRAVAEDPARFDSAPDAVVARVVSGGHTRLFLDLRPSILLRSDPAPARVLWQGATASRESLLGETPLRIRPARLETGVLRLERADYADTSLSGAAILAGASERHVAEVRLRRVTLASDPVVAGVPLHRRAWVRWGLLGSGAAFSGISIALRREGDRWYDRYLESSDRRQLERYFDRAVRYDRLSVASLAVGQVLITGGLVLLLSGPAR